MTDPKQLKMDCQLIRCLSQTQHVVSIDSTGAIIPIRTVDNPVPRENMPLVHPLRPVKGKVLLGRYDTEWFTGCVLELEWDTWNKGSFPPPIRHQRKRKNEDSTNNACFTADTQGESKNMCTHAVAPGETQVHAPALLPG
jgi:hypothetical protein